jgi:hypothetical protein
MHNADIIFSGINGDGCGIGRCCNQSMMLDGQCHYIWEVNYVMIGTMSRLCGHSHTKMQSIIAGWKLLLKPLCEGGGTEWNLRVVGWANLAYSIPLSPVFGRDYFHPHPEGHPSMKDCLSCECRNKMTFWGTKWP